MLFYQIFTIHKDICSRRPSRQGTSEELAPQQLTPPGGMDWTYVVLYRLVTVIRFKINPDAVSEFFRIVLSADILFFWKEYPVYGRITIDSEIHLTKDR